MALLLLHSNLDPFSLELPLLLPRCPRCTASALPLLLRLCVLHAKLPLLLPAMRSCKLLHAQGDLGAGGALTQEPLPLQAAPLGVVLTMLCFSARCIPVGQ